MQRSLALVSEKRRWYTFEIFLQNIVIVHMNFFVFIFLYMQVLRINYVLIQQTQKWQYKYSIDDSLGSIWLCIVTFYLVFPSVKSINFMYGQCTYVYLWIWSAEYMLILIIQQF